MKNKIIIILQIIFMVLLSSCKEIDDNYIINEKSSCKYFSYLKNFSTNKTGVNHLPISEEVFFINMENHTPIEEIINNQNSDVCSKKCHDVNLNAIYESLLAKNVLENIELNKKMSLVFQKIFKKTRKVIGEDNFNDSITKWINTDDSKIVFPSSQRQNITKYPGYSNFSKEQALKYALGIDSNPIGSKPPPITMLQVDYLLFHSKGLDNIEHSQLTREYLLERDYYFNSLARRVRGYRNNRVPKKQTLYYGISIYDIPELKAPKNSVPWRNWGRDSCIVEQNKNLYGKSVYQLNIPMRCSISGTTNLAIWPIYAYGLKLNEDELRLFILAVWASLSLDTGHVLQEVLSSVKISAIYLKELIKYNDKSYLNIKNSMPKNTLRNIVKVVQNIRPLGNSDEIFDRNRIMQIKDKIYAQNNSNSRLFSEIHDESLSYKKDKEEMKDRSDLEYYFNNYDLLKLNRAKFGAYYDGFFRKISDNNFREVRKKSQEQLKKYFKRDCLIKQ